MLRQTPLGSSLSTSACYEVRVMGKGIVGGWVFFGCGGEDREIVEHPTRPPEAIKIILHGTAIRAKPFFFPQKTVHFPLDQTFISQLTHSFPRAVP